MPGGFEQRQSLKLTFRIAILICGGAQRDPELGDGLPGSEVFEAFLAGELEHGRLAAGQAVDLGGRVSLGGFKIRERFALSDRALVPAHSKRGACPGRGPIDGGAGLADPDEEGESRSAHPEIVRKLSGKVNHPSKSQ